MSDKPLFELGEVVIRAYPDGHAYAKYNGEYVIESVFNSSGKILSERTGVGYVYGLLGGEKALVKDFSLTPTGEFSNLTSERFLRKKHQPGTMSFDQLMSELKQPIEEKVA